MILECNAKLFSKSETKLFEATILAGHADVSAASLR